MDLARNELENNTAINYCPELLEKLKMLPLIQTSFYWNKVQNKTFLFLNNSLIFFLVSSPEAFQRQIVKVLKENCPYSNSKTIG